MAANLEKPFDYHYFYGCLLQLLLFYYDISKTVVFWMNVVLILSTAITGNFGQLCFAVTQHIEMAVQLICSVFRTKPLDAKYFQIDTTSMRQQRLRAKLLIDLFERKKRIMIEKETQKERDRQSIYDKLAEMLDFVLNTKSRHQRRDYGYREETGSVPYTKSSTRDLRSFRKLNTSIIDVETSETSTQQLICQRCGLQIDLCDTTVPQPAL